MNPLVTLDHGPRLCDSMIFNCTNNCSGHGDCYNGVCFCEVQFSGEKCREPNISYYVGFSVVFYIISLVSFIQLLLCVKSEFSRMKSPSILGACRVTTQKALYLLTCVGTALRGFYFSSPSHAMTFQWTAGLMSAYYPILLTGASILVCFWAEVFHLSNLTFEKPGFLSKSIVGFVAFNLVTYSVLATELVLMHSTDNSSQINYFTSIFKSVYALLMLVVLVFFLFYGVEVFFKVRGAFRLSGDQPGLNFSQLQQSRLGLVSQALILLLTTGFILSDVLGSRWKDKVPVLSRNTHHVLFRVAELGAALWFPCVLWNCFRPEQLWILNPKKLLKRLEQPSGGEAAEEETDKLKPQSEQPAESLASTDSSLECWICYDMERTDAGPLIQPCQCKGDMSAVHHDCLKTWLIESAIQHQGGEGPRCKVCNQRYQVTSQQGAAVWKLGSQHWCQTASTLTVMTGALGGACLVVRMWDSVGLRTLAVGAALLIQYIGLKLLGFNLLVAYHRAKMSAVQIMGRKVAAAAEKSLLPSEP